MKNILLTTTAFMLFSFMSYSQDMASKAIKELKDCACDEIIMIAGGLEKKYTHSWLTSVELEDGMIAFKKGSSIHLWNPNKIIFIEKGGTYIRVHMDAAR